MSQGISSVSERLEHIETLSRETRDELREVLGALGRLAERSDAHNQALAGPISGRSSSNNTSMRSN